MAVVAVGVPLLLFAAVESYAPRGERGLVFVGYARSDLMLYSAHARELFENGNGLFEGNPYSISDRSPRVYSQLLQVVLGWLWWLTGVPLPVLWQIGQVVFGVLMFLTLYRLVAVYFSGPERTYAFLVTALGNGAVWLDAARRQLHAGDVGVAAYLKHFKVASGVTIWFPNVFQNALFTTEAFYHALAFWLFVEVLRGRYTRALFAVFLLWWAHPFTGLEGASIVGAFALVEALVGRDGRALRFAVGVAAITLVFLAYYVVLIPTVSADARAIYDVHRTALYTLQLATAPIMWGVFLFGPILLLLPQARARQLLAERRVRFVVVWLVVVAALVLHDRVIPRPYEPIHFTHGYCFLPLAILTLLALTRIAAPWRAYTRRIAAGAFLLIASADNVFFPVMVATSVRPVIASDMAAVIRWLETQPSGLVLIEPPDDVATKYVPVATPHRIFYAGPFMTPFSAERLADLRRIRESASPAAEAARLGVHWVVVGMAATRLFTEDVGSGAARLVFSSGRFSVLDVSGG